MSLVFCIYRRRPLCTTCGKFSHQVRFCRYFGKVCYYCSQMGHISANCPLTGKERDPVPDMIHELQNPNKNHGFKESNAGVCIIGLAEVCQVMYQPCGHSGLCIACDAHKDENGYKIFRCPICRIVFMLKVFVYFFFVKRWQQEWLLTIRSCYVVSECRCRLYTC